MFAADLVLVSHCLTLSHNTASEIAPAGEGSIRVVVRKRPLFDYEVSNKGQYDVVTAVHDENGTAGMVVTQCRQKIMPRRGIVRELGTLSRSLTFVLRYPDILRLPFSSIPLSFPK